MNDNTLFEVDETLTVGQLNRRLGEAVKRTFRADLWVQGQIRNLSRSGRGHVYFDLCEPTPAGGQPKASIAVTLFDSNRQIVNRIITRTGNSVRIDDGVEVRIKATVELYAPRGQVQLNMTGIDPEFTLGRLGADRDQLLKLLTAERLLDANKRVPLPLVPLRVGLITSGGSAAHADFAEQVTASGYAFEILTLSTRVQGEFAPQEIADMIQQAQDLAVDVIALVRGGGARTDLAAFDAEPVARAIAGSALPVLCGIGHEIDSSVADTVAHASLKTPTACAQFLVERVIEFDFALAERNQRLIELASTYPSQHQARLDVRAKLLGNRAAAVLAGAELANNAAASGLERRASSSITASEQRLTSAQANVIARSASALAHARRNSEQRARALADRPGRVITSQRRQLDLLEAKLSAVDPMQALKRGYSVTTTPSGQLVRHADQVDVGTELITRLGTGSVTSTVTAVQASDPSQDSHDQHI